MAHTLTSIDFSARIERARPALLAHARRTCGQDAEDVLGDAMLHATRGYPSFKQPESDNGGAFVNWLHRILHNAIADYHRRQDRLNGREVSLSDQHEETICSWESRWAALQCENERQVLADAELIAEARFRLRFADLTDEERTCLAGRLDGEKLKWISVQTKLSIPTVCRRIQSAVEKLRSANVTAAADAFRSPDLDKYEWRVGTTGAIYHAPPSTGSQLARERLAAMTLRPVRRSAAAA